MNSIRSQSRLTNVIVLLFLLLGVTNVADCALPSTLKVCSRNETKINQCIIDAVEHIRTNLAKGDFGPDFNVPKLEPLFIEQVKMQNGKDLQAVVNKVNVSGCSAFKIERMQSKPMNLSFDLVVSIPKLNFTGKYTLKMKLLLLNLQGKGDINGTLTNVRLSARIRGYTETIDGKNYVRFHRLGIRLKVDDGRFQLDNLFNGDPVLGKVGNQVINENSRIFLDELLPGLEKNLSKLFTAIANNLLKNATIDEMFPEKVAD
ncbi:protein takeout-like [Sabethes cyaneus]|uniref:protein takeout-like n=1 Tax=Sabethes cyaneus TaxID=53552 RepID=UPI00237E2F2B|nr:protein takeout-like [Sabethes cyaneus]